MPKIVSTRMTVDREQTDNLAWIVVLGECKPLASGGFKLDDKVRILGAYKQKALAIEHMPSFATTWSCSEQIESGFYVCLDHDSADYCTYVRLEPLPSTGYERPRSRDKHPLSSRIVRG